MAAPGDLNPLFDLVSVSYELINRNTLQPISHSGFLGIVLMWGGYR